MRKAGTIAGLLLLATALRAEVAPYIGNLPPDVREAVDWIANPSFEEGTDGNPADWAFLNMHEITSGRWSTNTPHSGRQCVSVEGGSGLAFGRWVTPYRIPLAASQACRLGFWHRGTGGVVKIVGNGCEFDPATGVLTEQYHRRIETTVVKTEPSDSWRYYETTYIAPGYPSRVRLALMGFARDTCYFDDVSLLPAGAHLVAPRSPALLPVRGKLVVEIRVETGTGGDPDVEWECRTPGLVLESAERATARGTWRLSLAGYEPGVHDLVLAGKPAGGPELLVARPDFVRIHAPLAGTFAFTAFTDAHFYRPGANERNEKFGRFADAVNALDPLFALALGDQMEICNGAPDGERMVIMAAIKEQLGRLDLPVYAVAGNHDIDKTYEGANSRWYHEQFLRQPAHTAFTVEDLLFAGIDTMVTGLSGRDHGGGLTRPGEAAWLDATLAASRAPVKILWGHISPYGEFPEQPDRDRLLGLIYSNRVNLVLNGHVHYNREQSAVNPLARGLPLDRWPQPEVLGDAREVVRHLADPARAMFLETTTPSAFLLGGCPYNGYRHFWVRDRKIVWQDTLPISLAIHRENAGTRYRIQAGPEKDIIGLPLQARLPEGDAVVQAAGKVIDHVSIPWSEGGQTVWAQVDLPAGGETVVDFQLKGKP